MPEAAGCGMVVVHNEVSSTKFLPLILYLQQTGLSSMYSWYTPIIISCLISINYAWINSYIYNCIRFMTIELQIELDNNKWLSSKISWILKFQWCCPKSSEINIIDHVWKKHTSNRAIWRCSQDVRRQCWMIPICPK